ncbi:hypothetical protein F8388_027337 [Cannabis sativa]|uniref:Uncharacterized protein n=1 Tax=Cannabis sativa TaxID=3483 RepID=A0A7J6E7G5_CANSA|nr:hypothetical protein F8388_027337 [Cannabis sativa]
MLFLHCLDNSKPQTPTPSSPSSNDISSLSEISKRVPTVNSYEEETKSWKKLINVAVSGAAGMISNHLLFKLAAGEVFGPDQPIALKLLGSERSIQALEGELKEISTLYTAFVIFKSLQEAEEAYEKVEGSILIEVIRVTMTIFDEKLLVNKLIV